MRMLSRITLLLLLLGFAFELKAQSVADTTIEIEGVSFVMKYVKGGSFTIAGVSKRVKNYYLGETEVTQELWEAIMGKNPSTFQGKELDFHWGQEESEQRPVEKVSWNDCQEFIAKLNEATDLEFRLPYADEWFYAASGGRLTHHYQYPGGDDINAVAWYSNNSGYSEITGKIGLSNRTQQVKQKQPNELGLYDMCGNVSEIVLDRSEDLVPTLGGGFHSSQNQCKLLGSFPVINVNSSNSDLGLRLLLPAPDSPQSEIEAEAKAEEKAMRRAKTRRVLKKVGVGAVLVGLAAWWYFTKE